MRQLYPNHFSILHYSIIAIPRFTKSTCTSLTPNNFPYHATLSQPCVTIPLNNRGIFVIHIP